MPPTESRATISRMLPYASNERCPAAAELCHKAYAREPLLPVLPAFGDSTATGRNPCLRLEMGRGSVLDSCLPGANLLGGWHTLASEALEPMLSAHPKVRMVHGQCFGHWNSDQGVVKWARAFGAPRRGVLLLQACESALQWYPAFAGDYLKAWNGAYGPCKQRELQKLRAAGTKDPETEYFGSVMWQTCRPAALAAHDAATGTGGPGAELTPPFAMRNVYGASHGRLLLVLRNPVDRLETAFWVHPHYPKRYGASAEGLHAYVVEQASAFDGCERRHGARRCAYLFEYLGQEYGDVFFHCDQLIRGLYEPFVRDWVSAFGNRTLAVRAEDLFDEPQVAQRRVLRFLGLPALASSRVPATEYAAAHQASLKEARFTPRPMRNATRRRLEAFYAPHNARLAQVLGDPRFLWRG